LKKYDLQESYNNCKIKLKITFCESGPMQGSTNHIFNTLAIVNYEENILKYYLDLTGAALDCQNQNYSENAIRKKYE